MIAFINGACQLRGSGFASPLQQRSSRSHATRYTDKQLEAIDDNWTKNVKISSCHRSSIDCEDVHLFRSAPRDT